MRRNPPLPGRRRRRPRLRRQYLSHLALACGRARVVTQVLQESANGFVFNWLGHSMGHHDMSHNASPDSGKPPLIGEVDRWWASQMGYFADKLNQYKEADGTTMLQSSCILWAHELSIGDPHLHINTPWVMLGGLGGALRTGRFLKFPAAPDPRGNAVAARTQNDLFVALLRAVGDNRPTFGLAELNSGPLPLASS